MSVLGNPITLGAGSSDCVVTVAGRTALTSFGSGIYGGFLWADEINFDYSYDENNEKKSSSFVCLKPGTYDVHYYIKGEYNSSGDFKQTAAKLEVNGTQVESVTTASTSGEEGVWTVTLAYGDELTYDQRVVWSSSLKVTGSIMILKHH